MEWRTEAIEKRMQDMASSSVMMNRVLLSTQEAIEELRLVFCQLYITPVRLQYDLHPSLVY